MRQHSLELLDRYHTDAVTLRLAVDCEAHDTQRQTLPAAIGALAGAVRLAFTGPGTGFMRIAAETAS